MIPPTRVNPERYGWDWSHFKGSAAGLAWNHRDLQVLDYVIGHVPNPRVAVQAGGNLGIFPKRLAQVFEAVYTFEPDAELFRLLVRNAPEANIIKIQAALGEARGLVGTSRVRRLGRLPDHEGLAHVAGPGIVPTLRVDDLGLAVCDLLYLDIEGWELHALRGAAETLARCRPILAVEVSQTAEYIGLTPEGLRAEILAFGYRRVTRVLADEVFVPVEEAA